MKFGWLALVGILVVGYFLGVKAPQVGTNALNAVGL